MPGGGRPGAELRHELARELGQVERLARDRQSARVEPRQVEEVRREPGQARNLLAHLPDELVARALVEIGIVEQLQESAEREERRPQLVRGVGDELAAGPVEVREAQPHALERPRQLTDLVRAVVDHRLVEVALRDPFGRRSSRRIRRVIRVAPA